MPRKKSPSGRIKSSSPANRLLTSLDRLNRKLMILERNRMLNTYSSKKLINRIGRDNAITYDRKSKTAKIKVNVYKLNTSQLRYYQKVFDSFLKSKTSTPIGITETRAKAKESMRESLGEIVDREATEEDVDDFYNIVMDEDYNMLADMIDPSEMYALVSAAKDNNMTEDKFMTMVKNHITTNNEDTRNAAKRIYNKFIRG